jgi:hypothetical protein
MARSPRATRVRERRSVVGIARTKRILIALMRLEKSSSPSGRVMMQCMCSGSTTQASITKGRSRRVRRTASRRASMCRTNRSERRSGRLIVKK